MQRKVYRLALAALLAGSTSLTPLVSAAASPASDSAPAISASSVGAVVALTAAAHRSVVITPSRPATTLGAPSPARGMLAAEVAGTGNYGAPLISGCAWATWVTNCGNLTAYGNGNGFGNVGCGPPNGCKFGPEFQCEELAIRYAYYAWGEPTDWWTYGATGGASTMWQAGPAMPIPLAQFANGGGTPPMQGDLMIFAPGWLGSYWDGSGHVAIVRDVGPGYVDIVEQNATSSGTDRFPLSGSRATANGYTPIIGWLRQTQQTPVELASANVAGPPQSVSDQAGNMDVIWRDAASNLHDMAYRNRTWSAPLSITLGNAASTPAVVSPAPGEVDAFWADSTGHLWQGKSQAGFYGAETWLAPVALNVGTLAPGSAPTAVSQASGALEVFWKATDGTLWMDSFTGGAWSTPVPLATGVVTGNPDAVAAPDGSVAVVWRDAAGNLWSDLGASYGWFGAQKIGPGGLASDPTAVVAGPSSIDAIWRTTAGSTWAAGISSAGGSSQVEVDKTVSMGRPVAAGYGSGSVSVVMQRPGGSLASAIYAPSNGWIGPLWLNQAASASGVSVLNWYTNAVAAFWQGSNGSLWWSAACAGCAARLPAVFS